MPAQALGIVKTGAATVGSGVGLSALEGRSTGTIGVSAGPLEHPASRSAAEVAATSSAV
jgi:polysaccharide pyruvyl transferase WcaK-like protein